jgi:hypothetical protein
MSTLVGTAVNRVCGRLRALKKVVASYPVAVGSSMAVVGLGGSWLYLRRGVLDRAFGYARSDGRIISHEIEPTPFKPKVSHANVKWAVIKGDKAQVKSLWRHDGFTDRHKYVKEQLMDTAATIRYHPSNPIINAKRRFQMVWTIHQLPT